ncbi:3-oxo-tetronate kinase [Caproiciproducens faecalis]|uniref:3-oxo-tetronate kinase n=1 Tax=Caproiciproducens faecalis TaxID=2820301 RepID=A0ABS7DNI8_9FIRM|nr:3-oxo-tetronate kinase [Caproiciproducens faecalis]MBW7572684.1 four-carbon acid sugar kinase family protein [Caproiciproducens faecalis]
MLQKLTFGCIADDFTGASDAASFLVKGGMKTVLYSGVPDSDQPIPEGVTAAVIALKTRTEQVDKAVSQSLQAAQWLKSKGAEQLYVKYCSTFDSTPAGNIGPICDAVLERYEIPFTVLCPSLPVNKRTVKDGTLFVDGTPLSESSMKNHPLTPMWDSYLPSLMSGQSKYPCLVLGSEDMAGTDEEIRRKVDDFAKNHPRFYLVPDFVNDTDADRIISVFGDLRLLTGGSGLMQPIAEKYSRSQAEQPARPGGSKGPAIIVAGSCSVATQGQVRHYLQNGGFGIMVRPGMLLSGDQTVDSIWNQVQESPRDSVLIYSAGSAGQTETETDGASEAALLENTMSELVRRAAEAGYTRLICAGGETSGAVTKALGYYAYQIGESIAPGVPVMIPLQHPQIRLVLKSGNFGQKDFFMRALKMTAEEEK